MEPMEMDEAFEVVNLEMEDGSSVEFAIVDNFTMEDQKYVVLVETDGDLILDDDEHTLLMRDASDDTCAEDEVILDVIEDEAEMEKVCAYYDAFCMDITEE